MQYQVSYDKGSIYSRKVKFTESYTKYVAPISYLYKCVESMSIFKTDTFFIRDMYDTGYHHTEKFAYKNNIRKANVLDVDTFAFRYSKRYAFTSKDGYFTYRDNYEVSEKQLYKFADREIRKNYNVFGDIFANNYKNTFTDGDTFLYNSLEDLISLKSVETKIKDKVPFLIEDIIMQKVHLRSANKESFGWLSDLRELNNKSISGDSIELIDEMSIYRSFTGFETRVLSNTKIYDFNKASKIKMSLQINHINNLLKNIYDSSIAQYSDVSKDINGLTTQNVISQDVITPYLMIDEYSLPTKAIGDSLYQEITKVRSQDKKLYINDIANIGTPVKSIYDNLYIPTILNNKIFQYNHLIPTGSIIKSTNINKLSNVDTIKGSLKEEYMYHTVSQRDKEVSKNRYTVINSDVKGYRLRSELKFFKLQKNLFKSDYVSINVKNKLVDTENGPTFETKYKGISDDEMYCVSKNKGNTFYLEHEIISDIIKETYFEKINLLNKLVKNFKNSILDNSKWVYRNELLDTSIYKFDMSNKDYKAASNIEVEIINKVIKEYKNFSAINTVFVDRNHHMDSLYDKHPRAIEKLIKVVNRNVEIAIVKNLHSTSFYKQINVFKTNYYGVGLSNDTLAEKEVKIVNKISSILINKIEHNFDIFNRYFIVRNEEDLLKNKDYKISKHDIPVSGIDSGIYNVIKDDYSTNTQWKSILVNKPLKNTLVENEIGYVPNDRDIIDSINTLVSKSTSNINANENLKWISKVLGLGVDDINVNAIVNEKEIHNKMFDKWYAKSQGTYINFTENNVSQGNKYLFVENNYNFSKENHYLFYESEYIPVYKIHKELYENNNMRFFKFEKDMAINNINTGISKNDSNIYIDINTVQFIRDYISTSYNDNINYSKRSSIVDSIDELHYISKGFINSDISAISTISKGYQDIIANIYNNTVSKDFKGMEMFNEDIRAIRPDISMDKYLYTTFSKDNLDTQIESYYRNISKADKLSSIVGYVTTYKNQLDTSKNNYTDRLNKTIKIANLWLDDIKVDKIFKDVKDSDNMWITKDLQDTFIDSDRFFLYKSEQESIVDESYIYNIFKNSIDTKSNNEGLIGYGKYINTSSNNDILGFNINPGDTYIKDVVTFNKGIIDVTVDDGSCKWLNNFKTSDIIETIIKLEVSEKDIDNSSIVIEYNKEINATIHDTTVKTSMAIIDTSYNDTTIKIDSVNKDIFSEEDLYVGKKESNTDISKDVQYDSIKGNIFESENTNFETYSKNTTINKSTNYSIASEDGLIVDDTTVTKRDKIATGDNKLEALTGVKETNGESVMTVGKVEKNTSTKNNIILDKTYIIGNDEDTAKIMSKSLKNVGEEDTKIIIAKLEHLIEKVPSLQRIITDRTFKEVYIECSGKWVDGDSYDKPNLGIGGIDELLLPGTDFDYTKLEGKVIDKDGRPVGKAEVLDNRTFITTTPIKHPLPESINIGIDYIDLNINVLRHMIDVTYKLWMKKAFQFGAIDMREAMHILIEDVSAYANLTMDGPTKIHAARVVRLIRWYGEAAINNNAKYKITVDYGKLSSDLYEGKCKIPHNFDNMHIDNNMYTITNTLTGAECSAEFYIDNPVKTKLQFIIQVTSGTAKISLNGEEVGRVGVGIHKLEYDIEKLEAPNILNIFYNGLNNGIINLSNLVIFDMRYNGYSLEYHPVRGTGNKVMDDLVKYLSNYEDILDNNQEYIEAVKDNNYAITDVISKMLEYFELHHEGKNKGKRLTIKK